MGIDNWCSRSWSGSLCLLLALVGAPGCNDLLGAEADIPDATTLPDGRVLPNAAAPAVLAPAALVDQFPDAAPQQALCGDPLLGPDFSLDGSELPTLYVDAASDAEAPDGSQAAPFRTLSQALSAPGNVAAGSAQALVAPRRVLAASGYYDEDVAIPPGTLLFGGYDARLWEVGAEQSVITGSVYVGAATASVGSVSPDGYFGPATSAPPPSPSATPLTALTHFVLSSGVEVVTGARALLRDNLIAPLFFTTAGDPPGMRRAMAVVVNVATVRADGNRLVMPASDPATIASNGFYVWDSCAWITENRISDYRTPISFYKGLEVAATFNVMHRAENGIGTTGNHALIAGNFIHAYMPLPGCVYAITMNEDAHPDIRDNTIYLLHQGNRGISELDNASRPNALLGNRFYSPQADPTLYIHHRNGLDLELITSVGPLNALPEVPTIGSNTFARVPPTSP